VNQKFSTPEAAFSLVQPIGIIRIGSIWQLDSYIHFSATGLQLSMVVVSAQKKHDGDIAFAKSRNAVTNALERNRCPTSRPIWMNP
jgi:hypothetical protein